MASDPSKKPDGGDGAIIGKIEEIERLVAAIANRKKTKARIMTLGLVAIIVLIGLFLYNIVTFCTNYDMDGQNGLKAELGKNVQNITDSVEIQDLLAGVRDYMIPKVREEIIKKFEADLPKFKEEGNHLAESLQVYVEKDLNGKLINELTNTLNEIERDLVKNHPNITPVKIDAVLKEAQKVFIEELTQRLEKRVDNVTDHLVALNHSFEKLAECEDFRSFSPENSAELEAKLVEALLELSIYHVNPLRGNEPAYAVGGGK